MRLLRLNLSKIIRCFCLLFSLTTLTASTSPAVFPAIDTEEAPGDLVRVEVESQAQLLALSRSNVLYYTRLQTHTGSEVIYLLADRETQNQLTRLGLPWRLLDENASAAEYFLLYLDERSRPLAQAQAILLDSEGDFALVRGDQIRIRRLESEGVRVSPLHPKSLLVNPSPPTPQLPQSLSPDVYVEEMIAQLNTNTLYTLNGNLSGAWAVSIDGAPFTLSTRYTYAEQYIKKATRYTYDYLENLGLQVTFDYYNIGSYQARNVIAQQVGLSQPGRIYLLSAHLDSYSYENPYANAPGADDNASGAAALMIIADILRAYPFGCTLRYALFTGEEQGFYGSVAYAQDIYQNQENLQAVLNLDMIAYNTPNSQPEIELHTRAGNQNDLAIARLLRDAVYAYNLPLNPAIIQGGMTFSDHQSFWNLGYPAIMAIEDWQDHTPDYHHTSDRLATLNMGYYTAFAQAALATLAHMGCLMEGTLNGIVRDADSGAPISGARVNISSSGNQVRTLFTQADGSYQTPLLIGSYQVQASAQDYISHTANDVSIADGATTPLDFDLQYCSTIQGVDFTFSPQFPLRDQMVTFNATGGGSTPLTYEWDFGDGQSASGETVTHAYSAPGAYTVRLSLSNLCSTAIQQHLVPVEQTLLYFPLIGVGE